MCGVSHYKHFICSLIYAVPTCQALGANVNKSHAESVRVISAGLYMDNTLNSCNGHHGQHTE